MYLRPGTQAPRSHQLADNPRTAVKAAIKRASAAARTDMRQLVAELEQELEQAYRSAIDDLRNYLEAAAGGDSLRLEVMQDLLRQAEHRLTSLESARNGLLDKGLLDASGFGVAPFATEAAVIGTNLTQVADDAVRFVVSFVAKDGLQLSDRLWAIDNGARESVSAAIQRSIIQGHSASRAAQEFLARGQSVPNAIAAKMNGATPGQIYNNIRSDVLTGEGSAYSNALRVFRTELNRAHGEAYQAAGFEHPDVIGTRFLLSPRHPHTDICDMHARVNRYGLGPGVYPKGKNPWPAHPNTLSFVEVVFSDEVTDEDKTGKEDRISWLNRQDAATQAAVLGARPKQQALRQGVLRENEINTPWNVLKKRYQTRGVDITGAVPNPGGSRVALPTDDGIVIKTRVPSDFPVGASLKQAGDITRKMVKHPAALNYLKNADGEYLVRFRHGPRYRPDMVRSKKYNQASLSGLEVETVNNLNKALHETGQVADALGIPRLRGVNTSAGKALASMGDGVLAVAKGNNSHFRNRLSQADAIKHYETLLEHKQASLKKFDAIYKNQMTAGLQQTRSSYLQDMDNVRERLRKLRDGVPADVVTNPVSDWKPGSKEVQPFTTDAYFSLPEDKFRTTVWHEFGHHIHQQLRVSGTTDYRDPPLERKLAELFRKPDRVFPTRYSRTNHKEWFAESYSLYRLGRHDLIDQDLLGLIQQIERGEFTP